jgi:hypothetical protein
MSKLTDLTFALAHLELERFARGDSKPSSPADDDLNCDFEVLERENADLIESLDADAFLDVVSASLLFELRHRDRQYLSFGYVQLPRVNCYEFIRDDGSGGIERELA